MRGEGGGDGGLGDGGGWECVLRAGGGMGGREGDGEGGTGGGLDGGDGEGIEGVKLYNRHCVLLLAQNIRDGYQGTQVRTRGVWSCQMRVGRLACLGKGLALRCICAPILCSGPLSWTSTHLLVIAISRAEN